MSNSKNVTDNEIYRQNKPSFSKKKLNVNDVDIQLTINLK